MWNKIVYDVDGVLKVNIGRTGDDATVTMDKTKFDGLINLTTAQSVTSQMLQFGMQDPLDRILMSQYHRGCVNHTFDSSRICRSITPKVHWPAAMEVDVPEVNARRYASPILTEENLMPQIKRWEVLSNSIDVRVTYVRNDKVPSLRIQSLASEFVKLVVPEAGIGVPYSLERAREMLDKPTQVLAVKQVWETVDMVPRRLIEAFVKNEATDKSGRIISSFADMRFLLKFSQFTLCFRDNILHNEQNSHWFCPGLTPEELAEKVCGYVQGVDSPIEGDFSNFDGTVSAWCQRHVMNAVYLRYFQRESVAELNRYTDMLVSCPARAKNFGFRYDAGCGVKSGSPTTCDLNTVLNAFMQYGAIRLTMPDLSKEDAFRLIGLAFGDDSLFERTYQKQFCRMANELGMSLKVENYDAEKGVCFLARVFPDPYSTTTSFQDPLRTWKKLHLTTRDRNIPIGTAATDRVEGYLITDRLTPITSSYCGMVKRFYAEAVELDLRRDDRKSKDKEKPYWNFSSGTWPQAEDDVELMYDVIAARTMLPKELLKQMDDTFRTSDTAWLIDEIDRGVESSHKNTINEDGVLMGVDLRKHDESVKVLHQRASRNSAPKSEMPNRSVNKTVRRLEGSSTKSEAGPSGLQSHDRVRTVANQPRDSRPAKQANVSAGPGKARKWPKARRENSRVDGGQPAPTAPPAE
ncbi:MAG: RNA-dependent RNA polymerase [Guiyang nodavirus 3]|nr:MAG: RNA-dependent RNA polymerase [Guiyang nodavirus 3]